MLQALFEIGRRTLWFLTVVLALSVVTFALAKAPTLGHDRPEFFNSEPKRLNPYAWTLAQSVAAQDAASEEASHELARLGAVALPHVLPKLDSLPPLGRARVLSALEPIAVRMGIAEAGGNVAQLSSTWLTFLSDNSVYLHPAMVKRLVERFIADPSPQHARDLRRVDTFAVGALMQALKTASRHLADSERAPKLVEVLRQITGHDDSWSLPPDTDARSEQWERVIQKWKTWWFAERHLYEPPTATSPLTAPLLQTQFALWAKAEIGKWLDRGLAGSARSVPWWALLRSVSLFLCAIVGGNALAKLCSRVGKPSRAVAYLHMAVIALGWIPAALIVWLLRPTGIAGMWLGAPLVAWFGAALVSRPNRRAPTEHQSPSTTGASYTATLLCVCFIVEWGLRIEGLGPILVDALKRADTTPVLCVALVNTSLVGIVQYWSARFVKPSRERRA